MTKKHSYIYKNSNAENLRLYIIELTLQIEKTTSQVLGDFLNIDWKNSNSLGHKSVALSFNQKIQLIQDIKGLNKNDRKMFTDLMTIRNKFAHIDEIRTFKDFFNLGSNGTSVKKNLDNWYSKKYYNPENNDEEFKYRVFFHWLFLDIMFILIKKVGEHHKLENE
ncbi:hypothetical protein [Lutibacter citreus]|uniref:hypothetical protein n=1 Tax=Lutibacter citreus TaxID=2138210 RepID=UPI000DBE1DD4|nr:hypothetical protein [Lutibacter citreus]